MADDIRKRARVVAAKARYNRLCHGQPVCSESVSIDQDLPKWGDLVPSVRDHYESGAAEIIRDYEAALWQPIETAPTEGQVIRAWAPHHRTEYQISWRECSSSLGRRMVGWTIVGESSPTVIKFTHWCPLSEGPAAEAEVEAE